MNRKILKEYLVWMARGAVEHVEETEKFLKENPHLSELYFEHLSKEEGLNLTFADIKGEMNLLESKASKQTDEHLADIVAQAIHCSEIIDSCAESVRCAVIKGTRTKREIKKVKAHWEQMFAFNYNLRSNAEMLELARY